MAITPAAITAPTIGIIAAGAMGSAIGHTLTKAGCNVLTNLDGRSESTHADVPLGEIVRRAGWVMSILPPSEAAGGWVCGEVFG